MKKVFTVATYNLLAPCWKRLGGSALSLESRKPKIWKKRMKQSVIFAKKNINADILCLQEYWCCEKMHELFEKHLLDEYTGFHVKRTYFKQDGVCIYVKKDRFEIENHKEVKFFGAGNRVSLLLHVRSKAEDDDFEVIVGTTHLTFPHNHYDEFILRKEQLGKLYNELDDFRRENKIGSEIPFILTGDFNVPKPEDDVALKFIEGKDMVSSYNKVHKDHKFISHLNHRGDLMACDYIYFEDGKGMDVEDSYLYPKGTKKFGAYDTILKELSDHVPLITHFSYNQNKKKGTEEVEGENET